ncbi:MAG: SGNH/GDSL hydrolase family protein [Planctomycetota bacterium]
MSRARRRLLAVGFGLLLLLALLAVGNALVSEDFGGRLVFDNITPPKDLLFRWLPDQHLSAAHGFPLDINAYGLRDPRELTLPKPAGTYRLVCLGDSFTFGVEVPHEHVTAQVLERSLTARLPTRKVEVWNAGVSGYNSCQERLWLKYYGWALEPDLVTVGFVMNDAIPHVTTAPREFPGRAWMLRFPLYHWMRWHVVQKWKLLGEDPEAKSVREKVERHRGIIETRPTGSLISKQYWDEAMACLAELARECKARGVPVALIVYPTLPQMKAPQPLPEAQELLRATAAAEGMILVDLLLPFAAAGEAALLESDKSHPSPLGHEIAARELEAALARAGVLPPR